MRNEKCDRAGTYKNVNYAASVAVHFSEFEQIAFIYINQTLEHHSKQTGLQIADAHTKTE